MILSILLLAFSLLPFSSSEKVSADCHLALRRALNGRATWTMERTLGAGGRTLRSSGAVDCVMNSGIVWRVTAPFASSVAMTTNAMVFADDEGTRVKPLSELPYYAEIRKRTDAFVAGDAHAFDGLFAITAEAFPEGGWRLEMKPEMRAIERLFTEIVLTGNHLPTNAVLKTADGGVSVIRFRERNDVR